MSNSLRRTHPARSVRNTVVSAVVAALMIAGCGESASDRPELSEWQPAWSAVRDLLPDRSEIDDDGTDVCGDFLGEVRERRNDVIPAPTEALEERVTQWVSDAEALGLDCEREGDLAERLTELRSQGDEIDALIDGLEP